jgi:glycosyltransferase involved in cell wall biosynthesis
MKIAVLHTRLSGYLIACLRALATRPGVELLIYAWPGQTAAPFDPSLFVGMGTLRNRKCRTTRQLGLELAEFGPEVVLASGWVDPGYVKVCREMRKRGVPVIAGCDTQWKGSLRQQFAARTARWHVRRAIDVLWVTGARQAVLARALGYRGARLWDGYYACDWNRFGEVGKRRLAAEPAKVESPHFLFVGRYAPEKGIDTLIKAYQIYQQESWSPWELRCAGAGPLQERLIAAGAVDLGFIQPDRLPEVMGQAAVFVLPSRSEPWGVVVQEAAACGLPLICSDACGAAEHLLRDGVNGVLFPAGDATALADGMLRLSRLDSSVRGAFGTRSHELSRQYTPERWVETLVRGLARLPARGRHRSSGQPKLSAHSASSSSTNP